MPVRNFFFSSWDLIIMAKYSQISKQDKLLIQVSHITPVEVHPLPPLLAHPRIPKPLPITAIGTVIQGRNECITHLLREAGLLISDVKNYMDFLLKALEGCTSSSAFLRGEFDAAIHSLPKIKRVLGSLCTDSFSCRFSLYPFVDLMSFTILTPLNMWGYSVVWVQVF